MVDAEGYVTHHWGNDTGSMEEMATATLCGDGRKGDRISMHDADVTCESCLELM